MARATLLAVLVLLSSMALLGSTPYTVGDFQRFSWASRREWRVIDKRTWLEWERSKED
jgi:hypothetical protein